MLSIRRLAVVIERLRAAELAEPGRAPAAPPAPLVDSQQCFGRVIAPFHHNLLLLVQLLQLLPVRPTSQLRTLQSLPFHQHQ